MPVCSNAGRQRAALVAHVKVQPTRAGEAHAVTQLGDTEAGVGRALEDDAAA